MRQYLLYTPAQTSVDTDAWSNPPFPSFLIFSCFVLSFSRYRSLGRAVRQRLFYFTLQNGFSTARGRHDDSQNRARQTVNRFSDNIKRATKPVAAPRERSEKSPTNFQMNSLIAIVFRKHSLTPDFGFKYLLNTRNVFRGSVS